MNSTTAPICRSEFPARPGLPEAVSSAGCWTPKYWSRDRNMTAATAMPAHSTIRTDTAGAVSAAVTDRFYRDLEFGTGGLRFGHIWTSGRMEQNACLAPCITFALFLVCLAQFGLLAGIGFVFFHIVGSVAGSMRDMRLLMQGREPNPWPWRIGNWLVCFLLTAWLAGGFD